MKKKGVRTLIGADGKVVIPPNGKLNMQGAFVSDSRAVLPYTTTEFM